MANGGDSPDEYETADINAHVARLLRDMGNPEPPIRLEEVRALQKLDLSYYSKTDLNLLDEMAHQAKLAGAPILSTAKRMFEVVEQAGLNGLLLLKENDKKIFIDDDVPDLKRRFIIAHEITHDLLPWHREFLLGDNEITLSPSCHQAMEAEANYGGRRLIFLGDKFRKEAKDCEFNWKSIQLFKKRYGNTLTTTLWQMVCERDPSHPAFGMISRHPYCPDIGDKGDAADVAYFIRSNAFCSQFGNVDEGEAYEAFCSYATRKTRGPVGEDICILNNKNGEPCDFEMFSFSNGYSILTYGFFLGLHSSVISI